MQFFLLHALYHTARKDRSVPLHMQNDDFAKVLAVHFSKLLWVLSFNHLFCWFQYICVPALVRHNTWRPKMWAVSLVVQQPQKVLYQNMQTAMMHCSAILAAPPFLASDEFETNEIFPDIVWWQCFYLMQPSLTSNFHVVLVSGNLSC